ncbi:ead/Ea22-like family protein [Klebsiella pneumoniae]|uniref:ead/Ea22-like family protein n=1 Tax=Klebsiella pneumoniae TaxID=573 RepID=UPI003CFB3353
MTDITELAQSLKAAAEKATPGPWALARDRKTVVSNQSHPIANLSDAMHRMLADGTTGQDAEFISLANPANIRALAEALEKAQQVDEELCKLLPPGSEYMDPPDGGDVTPLEGVRRMVADYRKRIADLESRTATATTATAAAADVLAERKRQVTAEGLTPGHDDEYEHGELADAAGCYALSSELFDCAGEPPRPWPWPDEWWKPTNRRRDLVKAGALILAEIERLDRAAGIKVEAE